MDIITILTDFATEIFAAGETFCEHPEKMTDYERSVVDASHKAATRCMAMVLTDIDEMIRQSPREGIVSTSSAGNFVP